MKPDTTDWTAAVREATATGRAEVRRDDGALVCVLVIPRDELVCDDEQCVEVRDVLQEIYGHLDAALELLAKSRAARSK